MKNIKGLKNFVGAVPQKIGLPLCLAACLSVPVSFIDVKQQRRLLYDVARLHLTTLMDFWWYYTWIRGFGVPILYCKGLAELW